MDQMFLLYLSKTVVLGIPKNYTTFEGDLLFRLKLHLRGKFFTINSFAFSRFFQFAKINLLFLKDL